MLGDSLKKLKEIPDLGKQGLESLKILCNEFKKYVEKADDIGKKAHKEGKVCMKEIFGAHHPDPKYTDKELE